MTACQPPTPTLPIAGLLAAQAAAVRQVQVATQSIAVFAHPDTGLLAEAVASLRSQVALAKAGLAEQMRLAAEAVADLQAASEAAAAYVASALASVGVEADGPVDPASGEPLPQGPPVIDPSPMKPAPQAPAAPRPRPVECVTQAACSPVDEAEAAPLLTVYEPYGDPHLPPDNDMAEFTASPATAEDRIRAMHAADPKITVRQAVDALHAEGIPCGNRRAMRALAECKEAQPCS